MDASRYRADVSLRDGGRARLSAIRPDDKERLLESFHRLSERSVYLRFFRTKKELTSDELIYFTELDFDRHVGLVATLPEDDHHRIVGVGRYVVFEPRAEERRAEVAFAVADEHQGRGIGTQLLLHLAEIARAAGIGRLEADMLSENSQMLEVFLHSGFRVRRQVESGVVHVSISLEPVPTT